MSSDFPGSFLELKGFLGGSLSAGEGHPRHGVQIVKERRAPGLTRCEVREMAPMGGYRGSLPASG